MFLIENAWRDTAAPRSFSCVWEAPAICLVSGVLLQRVAATSLCGEGLLMQFLCIFGVWRAAVGSFRAPGQKAKCDDPEVRPGWARN